MINAGKISCSFSIFLQLSCNLEFHSWLVTVRGFYWSVMVLDHVYHLSALESSPLFLLNLPRPFHLILCCRLSFGPSSLLYCLYLHCFSDLTQPTRPFLLFLLPIHLLVLLPIIPYHLLLQLDPISEGEIPAAPLDFTLPHGPRSFFVLKKPIVAVWGLIFTQRTSIPAFKWSQLWKVIQSFDTLMLVHSSLCEPGPSVSSSVFCLLFSSPFHLSPLGGLRARLHSSSSVPNFLKFQFLAPVQENESSETKSRYIDTWTQFACPLQWNAIYDR